MSIINDALLKARQRKTAKPEDTTTTVNTSAKKPYTGTISQKSTIENKPTIRKIAKPKKEKFYTLIYVAGILSLILIGILLFKYSGSNNPHIQIAPISTSKNLGLLPNRPADNTRTEGVLIPADNRDTAIPGFLLTGIIHGEGASMAIINGSVYMEDDMIGSAKIFKITENTVIIENGAKMLELKVK